MLNADDIRLLLLLLAQEVVVKPSDSFPFTVTAEKRGYSDDPKRSALQAKLSIMLEAATARRDN